jgi:putative ABC transport system permease protein
MFRLNLKIALRNLWKNKGYTLINVLGLSIGMASCILIFIFINYQFNFDQGYKNDSRIFRIVSDWSYSGVDGHSQGVPIPLADAARIDMPIAETVAAIQRSGGIVSVKDASGKDLIKTDERVYYAQPQFFEIFDVKWIFGTPTQTLSTPDQVGLSVSIAKRFFGAVDNAVGKTIYFNKKALIVTGVYEDFQQNTSLPLGLVISYVSYPKHLSKSWGSVASSSECYVLIKPDVSSEEMSATMSGFNKKYYPKKDDHGNQSHRFQPLNDIHFNEDYGNFAGVTLAKSEIYVLAIIGCFLMLTACINFINLATAQAVSRSKEVGVRKVMGSRRRQLITQFLTETLTISVIALLIGCVISEFSLPYMQQLFGYKVSFSLFDRPEIFGFLSALVILVSLLAGFYPAMIMSGYSPALAIKNKVAAGAGSLSLRKVLVVVQFSITVILIIGTLVILRQMEYVRKKPLGFNADAVAMIYAPGDSLSRIKYETFKTRLLQIPGVNGMSFCQIAPLSGDVSETSFSYDGKEVKDFQVRTQVADENYFDLFDLKFVAGKAYSKSDTTNGYVVNETLLNKLNIKSPQDALGKYFSQSDSKAKIVGVVKDFNDKSLKETISPMAIRSDKDEYYNVAVKMDQQQIMPVMKQVEQLWNTTFTDYVYDAEFVNDNIQGYYEGERIMGVLFKVFASVIIFISFIGLFGLISYVATQRSREVAIRKVLGASTYDLVKMLNGSFLLMVFIANLVAWPLAYLFISKWLSGFVYRIDLSIWPFLIAMTISMVITLITVSLRSYRAASANTIDALKYE